ncbi:MAG: M20/M25/M40 family metallo-hydrolase [Deltaproteobacteria bacterium]|nr:M20/M25/M40 family metallo-hydrolase [Deltaproteobacteria bacterium]
MRRARSISSIFIIAALALDSAGCADQGLSADAGVAEAGGREAGAREAGADMTRADGLSPEARCRPSAALVGRVSQARLLQDLKALVALGERRSYDGQMKAAAYLHGELAQLSGFTVRKHLYSYQGKVYENLEARLEGQDPAAKVIVAGAHYDSISEKPTDAPGADDNASGTAAVLEAARALAGCRPARGVRLVFFSNEEVGTVGSQAYVTFLKKELPPSKVEGFLNVDTIAYGPAGEDLDLATKPAHAGLVERMAVAVQAYTGLKVKKIISEHCG